jgi:pentapeptide MXKDX repeat protein
MTTTLKILTVGAFIAALAGGSAFAQANSSDAMKKDDHMSSSAMASGTMASGDHMKSDAMASGDHMASGAMSSRDHMKSKKKHDHMGAMASSQSKK